MSQPSSANSFAPCTISGHPRLSPITLIPKSFPACTTHLIVSGCARAITTTCVAPACAIICASKYPPSIVFKSATIGVFGNSARNARTPCIPSAMMNGVPASNQSTPARIAICAISNASFISVKSSDTWTIGFMELMVPLLLCA